MPKFCDSILIINTPLKTCDFNGTSSPEEVYTAFNLQLLEALKHKVIIPLLITGLEHREMKLYSKDIISGDISWLPDVLSEEDEMEGLLLGVSSSGDEISDVIKSVQ